MREVGQAAAAPKQVCECAAGSSHYRCPLAFTTLVRLCRTCVRPIRTSVFKMRTTDRRKPALHPQTSFGASATCLLSFYVSEKPYLIKRRDRMKKMISWNVNGLRACVGKGFLDVFHELDGRLIWSFRGIISIGAMRRRRGIREQRCFRRRSRLA